MTKRARLLLAALAVTLATLSTPASALAEAGGHSPTADRISGLYDAIFWAAAAVFAVAGPLIVLRALRPPPQAADERTPIMERATGGRAELAWTVAPAIFLALIAVVAYRAFH
jgi:heme/copper-type cytochrome/quinol oxidase subunit 2